MNPPFSPEFNVYRYSDLTHDVIHRFDGVPIYVSARFHAVYWRINDSLMVCTISQDGALDHESSGEVMFGFIDDEDEVRAIFRQLSK